MRINHNIQALNAYRNLYQNQSATSKNLEKLSSGLRINRAADDAAGLAISEKMRSQIRGLNQAETNSLDGVSLMQVAEGAMTEVHSMLQRMRELTVQAANDTNTLSDREAIQLEVDELLKEIDSIASKTEFNTRRLLDGSSAADTQYIVGEMDKTNIVDVPVVKDASMKSGAYSIKISDTPKIVNTLNQPGAGISQSSVIRFKTESNMALTAGNAQSAKVIDPFAAENVASYSSTVTVGDKSSVPEYVTLTDLDNETIGTKDISVVYTPAIKDPTTGAITTDESWTINGSTAVVDSTTNKLVSVGAKVEISSGNYPTVDSDSYNYKIPVVVRQEVTVTSGTSSATFLNDGTGTETVNVGNLELTYTKSPTLANSTSTHTVSKIDATKPAGTILSDLPLGEYTITVTKFNDGTPPNATIEVFGTDGFSIGTMAAEVGKDAKKQFVQIGTEPQAIEIDVRQITQAGTAKIQIEAELSVEVLTVEKDADNNITNNRTAITFNKAITTRNGKLTHGGLEMHFDSTVKKGESAFDLTNKSLTFQIGANTNQSLNIDVPQLSTVKLGITDLNVLSHDEANRSLHKIDQAITAISATRAKLGATQNRLEHTISNLQVTAENLTSAESRIRDADMAKEMTDFTKNNILNQSAQAMLAQANQLPQGVLQLLQG